MITEKLYQLTKANNRRIKIKINLLSFQFNTIASLEGNTISGSIQIDANADIRRVADVSLVVTDSSFDVGEDKKIWLDKYVQIYMGMVDYNDEVEWINMGIYLIDNPTMSYDATSYTLSFQAYDLMSKMTGLRNGQLKGVPSLIPSGASIRGAMASTVSQLGGFNKFIINDNPQTVPYDIKIDSGGYVYDIIAKLRDISPNWETFFDVDGQFIYQPISAYNSDEVIADSDLFNKLSLKYANNINFQNVKNVIEVFGKSLDPEHYGDVATLSGSTYSISLTGVTSITPGMQIGFTTPSNNGTVSNAKLKINNLSALPLVDENGNAVTIAENSEYFVVYNPSKLVLKASGDTGTTYSATADVDGNTYKLTISSLTNWTQGTLINMTVPAMKIVLNGGQTYTISGSNFTIPSAGSTCYFKITSSSAASKLASSSTVNYEISNVEVDGLTYYVEVPDISAFATNDIIKFEAPFVNPCPNILINSFVPCQVYSSDGKELQNFVTMANHTYNLKIPTISNLTYLGHQQIHYEIKDEDPNSPFYIGKDLGEIRLVLKDGEYNNIYSDQLAKERAEYELYLHCRMEDTVDLEMVPVYWLDVNKKISLNMGSVSGIYVIKRLEIDLSPTGTMHLNAINFIDENSYTEVEYLQSSGTQYINALYKPNSNTKVIIDIDNMPQGSSWMGLFGSRSTTDNTATDQFSFFRNNNNGYRTDFGSEQQAFSSVNINTRTTIIKNKNVTTIGETTITNTSATFSGTCNMYIFAVNKANTLDAPTSGVKIYSCQIYDNDTLVRDFIPVLDKIGTACLYDKVTKQFFYNQGTGKFNYN